MIEKATGLEKSGRKTGRTVYCHFSFKRPKNKNYGLFAAAVYSDFEGKNLITFKTKKLELWKNQQFVTAIQSYENALACIYEWQGLMMDAGIRQVMLVTDNSTLAGWIENNNKNKEYTPFLVKANRNYKVGGVKEILLAVGLCLPRKSEKAYKFCVEDKVSNVYIDTAKKEKIADKKRKIALPNSEFVSALDLVNSDISVPEITGIEEV